MSTGFYTIPEIKNEPVKTYAPGTPERTALKKMLAELRSKELDIPMVIGGKEIRTDKKLRMSPPHEIKHTLGYYYQGDGSHVQMAIDAALSAREQWASLSWQHRSAIFLKAADLLAGPYRQKMNAATMLGQSKNAFQAEIDAACELADFFR
ncbi:MAG: aldehyde dehydrogenase family protein, partial [Bacteroidales bacterium]